MLSLLLPVNNPLRSKIPAPLGNLVLSTDNLSGAIIDVDVQSKAHAIAPEYDLLSPTELTFLAAIGTTNIKTVTIDGRIYQLGYAPLQRGEFEFNPATLDVIVALLSPVNANTVISYETSGGRGLQGLVATTQLCDRPCPDLIARWNAQGTIEITKTFEGHDSLTFSFADCKDNVGLIESELSNGREFSGFNQKWIINSVKLEYLKNSPDIIVTVSCQDWLASIGQPSKSPLDRVIRLKPSKYTFSRSLSEIASQVGISYRGQDIFVRVPKSTSTQETTTLRQLLESRAITAHGFVKYTASGVEVVPWGQTPIQIVDERIVKDGFELDRKGHGALEDGIKLATEYRNLKVNLEFDPDEVDQKQGVTQRWVFENCRSLGDLYSSAEDHGFYYKQPDDEILRNPGINFDAGGVTKKATKITEVNGTVTFEEHYEYGYAFASSEVYEIIVSSGGNYTLRFITATFADTYWREVKRTTTDYIYNNDGYLTTIKTTGTELTRLQQESEKLEAISLTAQALLNASNDNGIPVPDPSFTAQAEAYKFNETLPINDVTNFILDRHSKYFDDTIKPADNCDPDFVEPKFVALKTRKAESYIKAANPKNNEQFTYPLLVTGKFLTEVETNTVTSTAFPFKFEHRSTAQNSEGEYAKNAIALGTTVQNIGKPGIQTRLDQEIKPIDRHGNHDLYKNSSYYLSSPGVTGIKANEGSKSYPDVDSPGRVKAIAETELSIINTRTSLTTTLTLLPTTVPSPGDRILFQGKMWVVFDVSESLDVEFGSFNSSSLTLSLGRLLKPSLLLDNRSEECKGEYSITPALNLTLDS